MKKTQNNKKTRKWKNVAAVVLLAVVCIGGAELAVCSVMDPALFARVTAPVQSGFGRMADGVQSIASAVQEALRPDPPPPPPPPQEEEPEEIPLNQYATNPAIWTDTARQSPAITKLEVREEGEVLTGGTAEIIYYNQADAQWNDLPYGSDSIGRFGCGPVAMAMAVSALTEQTLDPAQMAVWAKENGHWAKGSGSYLSIVPGAAEDFGLVCKPLEAPTPEILRQELAAGKLAVALMGKGHFTQGGHFILLRGTTLDGSILVSDPNSRQLSLTPWDAQLILDELSSRRSHGGPLWIISLPGTDPAE